MAVPPARKRKRAVDGGPDHTPHDEGRPLRKKKRPTRGQRQDDNSQTGSVSSEPVVEAVQPSQQQGPAVRHALLAQYYPRVETLRAYLLTRLPASSRIRRKKLRLVGKKADSSPVEELLGRLLDSALVACPVDDRVGDGSSSSSSSGSGCGGNSTKGPATSFSTLARHNPDDRQQLRAAFSQTRRADESYDVTVSNAVEGTFSPQSEIVDFVVWLFFKRAAQQTTTRTNGAGFRGFGNFPEHVLCHGFQRGQVPQDIDAATEAARARSSAYPSCIPGLYATKPNQHVQTLKEAPWPQLLALLGASGEKIMADLLIDCCVFLPVDAGHGNFIQVTGKPLCDIITPSITKPLEPAASAKPSERRLTEITFVRSRMYYARPSITPAGNVHFGLKHIHVLNRFPYHYHASAKVAEGQDQSSINRGSTVHVMMYIFPRQFGLHNVFTSVVDRFTTAQKFQDYTLREEEIADKFGDRKKRASGAKVAVPKRLRGLPMSLTEKLRILHRRCSYFELLQHYCPGSRQSGREFKSASGSVARPPSVLEVTTNEDAPNQTPPAAETKEVRNTSTQLEQPPQERDDVPEPTEAPAVVNLATPVSQVSAFCQAVFKNVIPSDFWGSGDVGNHNKDTFLKKIDLFIRLRRYETLSLHVLMQEFKIADIAWLAPPSLKDHKLSQTDMQKRKEIFAEFLYYLFDSFLVPLIRSNFYVTESNVHRNRIFYFRHDVWRRLAEPAIASLKATMFEEIKQSDAVRTLETRELAYGQVRLLPKREALRPIVNLRRRAPKNGETRLASSANTVLAPVASMFNLEMKQHPERLGASMLSMRSIYTRLKEFKQRMDVKERRPAFYFAKVDVKSAFDTIPQEAIIKLIRTLPSHPSYYIDKYVEIIAPEKEFRANSGGGGSSTSDSSRLPQRLWRSVAKGQGDHSGFHDSVESTFAGHRKNTVFVDSAFRKTRDAESLVALAASHIQQNLIKVGKKFYRQQHGIPQGSVLSSALCNYFYADLEARELGFLRDDSETRDGTTTVAATTAYLVPDKDYLLLRLIDDFLLITTDQAKAARFVEVMHRGHPHYGVAVNPDKTLVNFNLSTNGKAVARVPSDGLFPYCGTYIHCSTLNLTRDRESKNQVVFNTLTVEHARSLGYHFKRKVFNFFKIQSHCMFFDTAHNSPQTTLRNLHSAFVETATKMWAYARCLPKDKRPHARLMISTISELGELAFAILNGKSRKRRWQSYEFSVSKSQMMWIIYHAFVHVLRKKQSGYAEVLAWLRDAIQQLRQRKDLRLPKEFVD